MGQSEAPNRDMEKQSDALTEEKPGPPPAWAGKKSPPGACCAKCGGSELSSIPAFALGSGIAYRPVADDVYCRRCGHMGTPK